MGSTQPSDPNLPFGFSVDHEQEFFFPEPPEAPPGAPLLSDNDTKYLSTWFDGMSSNQYQNTPLAFEGLNFSEDWLVLPPNFMGTSTSYGHQPTPSLGGHLQSHAFRHASFHDMMPASVSASASLMPPPHPAPATVPSQAPMSSLEQQPSAEVLAAASVLQTGSMGGRSSTNHHDMVFGQNIPTSSAANVGLIRHQALPDFRSENDHGIHAQVPHDNHHAFAEWAFGNSSSRQAAPRPSRPPLEMQWGSDSNFVRNGFVPQSERETQEALENERLKYMECLQVSKSAANTQPSSPVPVVNGMSPKFRTEARVQLGRVKVEENAEGPPKKRRKSKAKDDVEGGGEDEQSAAPSTATSKTPRKRKNKVAVAEESSTSPQPAQNEGSSNGGPGSGKRRKSSALNAAAKAARENLSEEQKRENHIKSEQRRRTLIKEGFDDLCDLVPGLKGGGFSKSTMLTMAAEWLEDMLQGNEQLREQLAALEGR